MGLGRHKNHKSSPVSLCLTPFTMGGRGVGGGGGGEIAAGFGEIWILEFWKSTIQDTPPHGTLGRASKPLVGLVHFN